MYNELTEKDIKKMQEEIDYRIQVLRPKISKEVIEARELGDLSENAEYRAARREKGQNERRIEFLRAMIKTAKIIDPSSKPDEIGMFDKVDIYFEDDDETETFELSTTMRTDAGKNIVSKESPFGRAIMGKKVGDRILIKVNPEYSYYIVIKAIKKCYEDDVDVPLS